MRRLPLPRVLWHLLAYAAVLAGVSAVVPLDASFGSDDGAYGGQVWALRQGSWVLPRPLPVVDAEHEGWLNGAIVAGGPVPYSTSPVWVELLAASVELVHGPAPTERAGDLGLGLHLPGLLSALAAAAAAWRLAGRWDRRAAHIAFWLVALSPLLVDTTTLWAHPLGTACAGWSMVAVAELWPRRQPDHTSGAVASPSGPADRTVVSDGEETTAQTRWRPVGWSLVLVGALALGAAVRTEAVFWTVALVAVALLADRSRAMVAAVGAAAAAAAAVWVANRAWGASLRSGRLPIETSVEALRDSHGWLASRGPAAWQLLGTWRGAGWGQLLSFAGMLLALGAAVALYRAGQRRRPAPVVAMIALVAAAALYLAKAVVAPDVPIPGIVAAWPAAAVALAAARWPARDMAASGAPGPAGGGGGSSPTPTGGPGPRWLLVPAGLMTMVVLATQYESSGGLQWGGRYLSMIYVPLGAAAAIAVSPLLFGDPEAQGATGDAAGARIAGTDTRRLGLGVALAALAVAPAVSGVATSHRFHTTHAMIVDLTTSPSAEVVITDQGALPRIGWTALPTTYYRADEHSIAPLLADLADAGVRSVNVAGLTTTSVDGVAGWHLASTNHDPHGTIRHLTRP